MRLRRLLTRVALAGPLALSPLLVPAPLRATTTCERDGAIVMGRYWLNNDIEAPAGSGWQCLWDNWRTRTAIGWGTSWSWSGRPDTVKAFASSVLGWRWGWKASTGGLPTRLSDDQDVKTAWRYQAPRSGSFAVAYDLWLHDVAKPGADSTPTDEVLVWTYRSGGAEPLGTKVGTVSVGGDGWDLYEGEKGWQIYTFVRTTNTSSVKLDLGDFLDYLRSNLGLSPAKYLSGVAAGAEVFTGSGQLNTTSYFTSIARR
ncbi:GH12 family glycosyl hydrolase domain-containing protein [Actinomadura sp. HBU206391]|uniref:GH12 family glycosyl hydrolase domain-containing protein n=1 Tax=Actinomadura sp. HBU206391 TaxID=2731692 RepID=UPI00164FE568|nr:endo-1,4-beta-glucanase [Actinomadura sp. HBU206391]MBC6458491.1 endo-1,4-beta-glucanase [Actinomadura sp. HBU206391]